METTHTQLTRVGGSSPWEGRIIYALDDDDLFLETLSAMLAGVSLVRTFRAPDDLWEALRQQKPDALLLDLNLGGRTRGDALLQTIQNSYSDLGVIVSSGQNDVRRALTCMRLGAQDYLVKPFTQDDLAFVLGKLFSHSELRAQSRKWESCIQTLPVPLIAESPAMRSLLQQIEAVRGRMDLSILLLGESGTGKEVLARAIHQQERQLKRPFVAVNMAALPGSLVEAELFGVEKGAFTDAKVSRPGRFELAQGGDIFLDEIGDLSPHIQAKLLRVLQEKRVERLGSAHSRAVGFRCLAATNRPLGEMVSCGHFRRDLVYRLSDLVLFIPPLRDRKEDILPLAHFFAARDGKANHRRPVTLSAHVQRELEDYDWPGNVRELESTLKRSLLYHFDESSSTLNALEWQDPLSQGSARPRFLRVNPGEAERTPSQLPEGIATKLGDASKAHERTLVQKALVHADGDKEKARRFLGVSRATFYRKLRQLGIEPIRTQSSSLVRLSERQWDNLR